jgi:pimeloyl-ACP methyl ester carboxylesterase
VPVANVNGLNIAFDIVGHGTRPWILTPGGRYDRTTAGVRELAEAIAAGGDHRVVIWDRPNCGESDVCFEGENESTLVADTMASLLQRLDMVPAVLAGGSAGARHSLLTEVRHPGTGMAAATWWISGGVMELFTLANVYGTPSIKEAVAYGMEAVLQVPDWQATIAKNPGNKQRILDQDPAKFIATMERWMMAFVPKPDENIPGLPDAQLRDITFPVLVFNSSDKDGNHPRFTSEAVAAALPNSRLVEPPWGEYEWQERQAARSAGHDGGIFVRWPLLAPQLLEWAAEVAT